ncbi:MAG: AAA family ATPase [Cyanobacteria bacterium SBLK]|nr:AAA family ATPase [Cyanobacteria bacterium SBLK]
MLSTDLPKIKNYQVLELIHESDRALVYRSRNEDNGQPVVIKLMSDEYPSFGELVRFRNQYAIAKNLKIEGIIKAHALERYENRYALIMEDTGGLSLAKYKGKMSLTLSQFLDIAIQLAGILHRLHQKNIIHKDIKPANILIHPETKSVKLIDFSISTLLPKETQTLQTPNVLEGTLTYLSPEQTGRMNRGIDYRSDFYSLGVTFYELLTGNVPFTSEDPLELIHAHIAQNPDPPSKWVCLEGKFCPAPLSDIVLKLMAKNAEDRYQSSLGLKRDLEKCRAQYRERGKIEAFELGERDVCDRFLIPDKLYGREKEVKTLLAAFERVSGGGDGGESRLQTPPSPPIPSPELLLVAGYSGIGKTAVINEVHKPIVGQRGYFIKGKFDQFNRNIPFSAFVQAFRDLMGQLLGESDTELGHWKTKILEAVGTNGQILIDVIPELEGIIGRQLPVPELSGSAAQNRFNLLFEKFIAVFTTREHPLTIFVDDLQWADSASLNLLKVLMGSDRMGYLLLLGAYRDNEVFPAHPLMLTLAELEKRCNTEGRERAPRKKQTAISTITLVPLSVGHINQLVAETLSCGVEIARSLTDLVYQKTRGNPFFTTQFLKGLHEDKFITFDRNLGYWECDLVQVRDAALTDDVVEFMAGRLQKLPQTTQNILKLAACIGNQFDLETLAVVCESSAEIVAGDLWGALREGLILPITEAYKFFQASDRHEKYNEKYSDDILVKYRFVHDRVQQAAYLLIDESQKYSVHLAIGKRLLAYQSVTGSDENIFNVLNHLMVGIKADPLAIPVRQLANLALSAGMKAKLSIAYQAAINYFDFGLSQLPLNSWLDGDRLKLDLSREKAECHYFLGHFEKSEKILNNILLEIQNPLDAARIYGILMTQRTTQGTDILSSVEAGIKGLAILGMELPKDSEGLSSLVKQEHQQIRDFFKTTSPTILLELPDMSDPVQQNCMKLLSILWSAAYVAGNPTLNWFATLRMMNLSLKYGRAESSSFSFCSYGMTLAYQGQYQEAYEFGRVALDVDRKFNNKQFIAKNNNHFGHAVNAYMRPLENNLSLYRQSFEICLELGDLIFGVWAVDFTIWTHIIKGSELYFIDEEIQKYLGYVRDVNDVNMLHSFELKQKFVRELIDESVADRILNCHDFFHGSLSSDWRQKSYDHGINWYGFLVIQRLYLQEKYTEAVRVARSLKPTLSANFGFSPIILYHTYYPLSLTALSSQSESQQKEIDWQELDELKQVLHTWSQNFPYSFLHKYQLVSAEIARIRGDFWNAMELYDLAIANAKKNGYIQEEALANELAAKSYLNWSKEKIARTYLIDAYYCYAQWGAKAKTDDLERRYPQLLKPILQRDFLHASSSAKVALAKMTGRSHTQTTTATNISSILDFSSLLKASQTLSGEIEFDRLLSTLMKIILENAGATKGALLLTGERGLTVEAIATRTEAENELKLDLVRQSIPLDNYPHLPAGLINTVRRTAETAFLDAKTARRQFATDRYLLRFSPQSLLCLPLFERGNLIGVLYLENCLTADAFTRDRIDLLDALCAQAAISLTNARLYQQAKQAVTDLQQAQLQLVQNEKMATLGNLVAGVAHEINNPVGFIGGNVEAARDHLQDLLAILSLYQQNTSPPEEIARAIADLDPEFIAEDFPKLIASMQTGCDRICNISTSLRSFSRTDADRKTEFNLHEGIESTLLILKYRLKANEERPKIEIIKNYGEIPEVKCYPGQINQVFMNLLANAIDALDESNENKTFEEIEKTPNFIKIDTELSEDKKNIIIRITDNGKGMPEEIKARIFEQGFTTKRVRKGTGLGMAIAQSIIEEKHDGAIACQSQLGKGTEFIISLPIE